MNIKNLSILLAFACAVPAYADETKKRVATKEEIADCGALAGLAAGIGLFTGIFPAIVAGVAAGSTIHCTLVPISKYLASGIAIPGGVVAGLATGMLFQTPYHLLMKYYKKTYDKESVAKIQSLGECHTEEWTERLVIGVPLLACVTMFLFAPLIASNSK